MTAEKLEAVETAQKKLLLLEFSVSGFISTTEHSSWSRDNVQRITSAFLEEISGISDLIAGVVEEMEALAQ